jgi:hypothetical protein
VDDIRPQDYFAEIKELDQNLKAVELWLAPLASDGKNMTGADDLY